MLSAQDSCCHLEIKHELGWSKHFIPLQLQLAPWASLTLKRLMQVNVKSNILMNCLLKSGRKIVFSYGLVRTSDMEESMKKFVVEMCVSCLEKYSDNSLVSLSLRPAGRMRM